MTPSVPGFWMYLLQGTYGCSVVGVSDGAFLRHSTHQPTSIQQSTREHVVFPSREGGTYYTTLRSGGNLVKIHEKAIGKLTVNSGCHSAQCTMVPNQGYRLIYEAFCSMYRNAWVGWGSTSGSLEILFTNGCWHGLRTPINNTPMVKCAISR